MHTSRRTVPKPVRRKRSLTYEIHPRVPKKYWAAVGATHVTRSLGTRDLAQAKRLVHPKMHELYAEWDRQLMSLGNSGGDSGPAALGTDIRTNRPFAAKTLTLAEVCEHLRARVAESERRYLEEHVRSRVDDPAADPSSLADEYRGRLARKINLVRDKTLLGHHQGFEWFITYLEKSGAGSICVSDALYEAMAATNIEVLERLSAQWSTHSKPNGGIAATSTASAPTLSVFTEAYIAERGSGLSGERADSIRANVRDLVHVTADKPVTQYDGTDASAFKNVLLALPPNWTKNRQLRHLTISDAAIKAQAVGLKRQSANNIKKKWSILSGLFEHAAVIHKKVTNPFVARALVVSDGAAENEAWDRFTPAELRILLDSDLPGHLRWLTWLGLFTGARLNELCQLDKKHFRRHHHVHYIHFSPELRLKTRQKKSCVRSIPLHSALRRRGILDYVDCCDGPLFPGLRQHKTGRYSDRQGKDFSRHLKEIGIKRPRLSFQSLRHTFAARFKAAAPQDIETRERLLGHVVSGVAGRYGSSYEGEAEDMDLLLKRATTLELLNFGTAEEGSRSLESLAD